jgi:hypothetical protein
LVATRIEQFGGVFYGSMCACRISAIGQAHLSKSVPNFA